MIIYKLYLSILASQRWWSVPGACIARKGAESLQQGVLLRNIAWPKDSLQFVAAHALRAQRPRRGGKGNRAEKPWYWKVVQGPMNVMSGFC